jgi:phosphoribosyl-ATP pyrophosphohydrolase
MSSVHILDRLYEVIDRRRAERPDGSYVVELQDGGPDAMAAKLREECEEVIEAARASDADHLAREVADLLFHTWVVMGARTVTPERVYAVLEERFGVGGLAEKAARRERDGGA